VLAGKESWMRPTDAKTSAATPIAVVIATLGRADGAARAAGSVLKADYPALALHVVDQSQDNATETALSRLAGDPRLQVVRAPARGLGAARNLGVRLSKAPIIAFTDDDCEVAPGWLGAMAAAFQDDPRLGLVFGSVLPADYDRTAGFIPAYQVRQLRSVRGLSGKARIEGIGACMAIRRSTWSELGGFDEALGAGAPLRAGEDADFAMRALLAGQGVHETPDAVVTHHGFRSFTEGTRLIEGYMIGLGAVNAKMMRLGGFRALPPLLALGWRWLSGAPVVDLNQVPPRLLRLRAFSHGAWLGLRTPLTPDGRFLGPRIAG
jgi:GT2 family glycosyltransferase